ncbi:MAG TPA: flagellar filament capping protein FliD [Acidimicrobiales bacterium]|nr:flagellar filament capping protein FliD [Acidimicrobiales bacterium]
MTIGNFGGIVVGPNGQVSFPGLITNLPTNQIIQALLTPYTDQVNSVKAAQAGFATQVSDWQAINTDMAALQTAANALSSPSSWQSTQATSSNAGVATATTSSTTPQGSVSFTVGSLASTDTWLSSGTVSSTGTIVDTNNLLLSQASQYGFSSMTSSSGLAVGAHTIDVTQAISAASTTSSSLLGSSTTITSGTNDTINVKANGTTYALTIAGGTYTQSQLATAINTAAGAVGAPVTASVNSGGYLTLATTTEGSGSSLQVTGGTALTTLGLATMSAAAVGSAGSVTVDGTVNSFDNLTAGSSVTLTSGTGGTISAVLGNGVGNSSGTFTATNISTGTGSLADVVANINAANVGIVASAVQNSSGNYVLQLSSSTTGAHSNLTIDPTSFNSSGLGNMVETAAGSDAVVTVGGSGGYSVSSQNNTISGLLPGLSVNLLSTSSSPVTVTVTANNSGITTDVSNLVNAANKALADIQTYGGYNSATKQAGPLLGQAAINNLRQQILGTFATVAGSSTLGSAMEAGVNVVYSSGTGQTTVQFDQAAFQAALAANPTQVQNLFAQAGTFVPSGGYSSTGVSLVAANNGTLAGSYAVNISNSATQATDTGTAVGASVTAAETLTFTEGSNVVNYTTTVGESLTAIAAGLNSQFASAGTNLSAQVIGGNQLQVNTSTYGSSSTFTVSSSNTGAGTTGLSGSFVGTDVAGTINGVAATGSGQFLSAPTTDPTLAGMVLQVTISGISSSTAVGTFNYTPGIAQTLATVANQASDPATGSITSAITQLNNASSALNTQITFYQNLSAQQQKALQTEFANLEAAIGALKNQQAMLSSATNSLAASGL